MLNKAGLPKKENTQVALNIKRVEAGDTLYYGPWLNHQLRIIDLFRGNQHGTTWINHYGISAC